MSIVMKLSPGTIMPNHFLCKYAPEEKSSEKPPAPLVFLSYETIPGSEVVRHGAKFEDWKNDPESDTKGEKVKFENTALSGFKVGQFVGGVQESYTRFSKKTYVEIIDPRGFMVHILAENFRFILEYCRFTPPNNLEGEFAYAWDQTSLRLLPVNEPSIQGILKEITQHTEMRASNTFVSPKDIKIGYGYRRKKDNATLIYLGRVSYYDYSEKPKPRHMFINDTVYNGFLLGTSKLSFETYANLREVFTSETSKMLSDEALKKVMYAFQGTEKCSPVNPNLGEKHYFTPEQFAAFLNHSYRKDCAVMSEEMPENKYIRVQVDSSGLYRVRLAAEHKEIRWRREFVETFAQKENGSELFSAEECIVLLKPYYYEAFLQNGRLYGYRCESTDNIIKDVNLFAQ